MKPFDLELAKAGHPVCTRDGRKARIICFDAIQTFNQPLVALIMNDEHEYIAWYTNKGKYSQFGDENESPDDLFMASKKKTVWLLVYKNNHTMYFMHFDSKYESVKFHAENILMGKYIGTFPIEFEE